jgi:hypothetical protein
MKKQTSRTVLTLAAVSLLSGAAGVVAAPITNLIVGADRDSHFRWVPQDFGNNGTASPMIVGENGFSQLLRTVISFDLNSIPTNAEINEAVLLIRQTSASGIATNTTGMDIGAYRLLQDWTELDVTSTKRTATLNWGSIGADSVGVDREGTATDIANSVADKGNMLNNFIEWNVTADLQAYFAGTATNFGWVLIAETEPVGGDFGTVSLNSTEAGSGLEPRLRVIYVPEPGAFGLVALGMWLFVRLRRTAS